jgi:hypothetical protein
MKNTVDRYRIIYDNIALVSTVTNISAALLCYSIILKSKINYLDETEKGHLEFWEKLSKEEIDRLKKSFKESSTPFFSKN